MRALDVGVIGGGTAGSAAAIFLARAGHHVAAVVDANTKLHGTHVYDIPIIGADDAILTRLLDAIRAGAFGDIRSVKGVVKTRADWVQFEVDRHPANIAPFAPKQKSIRW